MTSEKDLLRWSEALAAIARTGLGFTDNPYEAERFEEILHIAADIAVAAGRDFEPDELFDEWMKHVGRGVPGYQTPKVGVGAVVANEHGEVLLIQRSASGVWLYPNGWGDVGYSAAEMAVKAVFEKTGIVCVPERLIAVIDSLQAGFSRIPLYSLVFLCHAVGGDIKGHPQETLDVGWFSEDALPDPLAGGNRWSSVFAAIRGETTDVVFDPPRDPVWRSDS